MCKELKTDAYNAKLTVTEKNKTADGFDVADFLHMDLFHQNTTSIIMFCVIKYM